MGTVVVQVQWVQHISGERERDTDQRVNMNSSSTIVRLPIWNPFPCQTPSSLLFLKVSPYCVSERQAFWFVPLLNSVDVNHALGEVLVCV